jgi:hypothetical protein
MHWKLVVYIVKELVDFGTKFFLVSADVDELIPVSDEVPYRPLLKTERLSVAAWANDEVKQALV